MFVQRLVTRAWRPAYPPPEEHVRRAKGAGTDMATFGEVATLTDWLGMFVGYADADGIGVVLPVEEIIGFFEKELSWLMTDEQKKKWEERDKPRRVKRAKKSKDPDTTERDNFTDLLGKLAQVPKSEVDELRSKERED